MKAKLLRQHHIQRLWHASLVGLSHESSHHTSSQISKCMMYTKIQNATAATQNIPNFGIAWYQTSWSARRSWDWSTLANLDIQSADHTVPAKLSHRATVGYSRLQSATATSETNQRDLTVMLSSFEVLRCWAFRNFQNVQHICHNFRKLSLIVAVERCWKKMAHQKNWNVQSIIQSIIQSTSKMM